jgi:hypothetical protein
MPNTSTLSSVVPGIFATVSAFFGSGLLIAIVFGLITKILLYFFDKEIKIIAKFSRKYFDKIRK